ncbi:MAG: ankyrin repeat domain-containing protein [Vulcanimicrobiota bacterium]
MESLTFSGLALGLAWYATFLFQLVLHEAAHSLAAQRGGDDTAAASGLVTLDPVPHIRRHPFGTVVVPILSYLFSGWVMGWGSAPYNGFWADRYPHRAARMALAGPLANLFLLLFSGTAIYLGLYLGWFEMPGSLMYKDLFSGIVKASPEIPKAVPVILSLTFTLNMLLLLLNILPLPPLDGSGIIMLCMSESTARKWQGFLNNPTLSILGMVAAWKVIGILFIPFFDWSLNLFYSPTSLPILIALTACAAVPVIVFAGFFQDREKRNDRHPLLSGTAPSQKEPSGPSEDEIAGMQEKMAKGDFTEINSQIRRHPQLVNRKNGDGAVPLHYAADRGHIAQCRFLLEQGASVAARDNRGATPLHYAASKGHAEVVDLLLSSGAEINAGTDTDRATPLHCAAVGGFTKTAELLISRGADPDAAKTDGQTPLHRAAYKGHRDIVNLLISWGATIDIRDNGSRTPLDIAGEQGHQTIAELLIAKKRDSEDPQEEKKITS